MDENDIPDASLEIFQWPYDGKSSSIDDQTKYHAVVDGTYIIASNWLDPTIAFGIRIVSKSGTYTQAQINQYASTYRITIAAPAGYNFPRIDLCGIDTNGFQAWGQTYMSNPTTVGLFEYGAALVIDSPGALEASNGTNSGGITPSLVLTWTLEGFENQTVTTPICRKNFFAVLEEVRQYATYDSSYASLSTGTNGYNPTIQLSLASDMLTNSKYSDEQTRLFDSSAGLEIGHPTNGIPGFMASGSAWQSDYSPFPKDWPVLMEYENKRNLLDYPSTYSSSSPQSMGVTSLPSDKVYTLAMNGMICLKFRTNFALIKLTYPSGTGYKKIQYISMNAGTNYDISTQAYSCYVAGISDYEFWVIFKVSHGWGNNNLPAEQLCRLTFSRPSSQTSTTFTFDFKVAAWNRMVVKHTCTWLIGTNDSTAIGGTAGNKHWVTFSLYKSQYTSASSPNQDSQRSFLQKVGPTVGLKSSTGTITSPDSDYVQACSGPWEMYNLANRIGSGTINGYKVCSIIQLYTLIYYSAYAKYPKVCVHTQYPGTINPSEGMFKTRSYLSSSGYPAFDFEYRENNNTVNNATFAIKLTAPRTVNGQTIDGFADHATSGTVPSIFAEKDSRTWLISTVFYPLGTVPV